MREYGDVQYNMDYVEIYRVLCCDSQREFPNYITAGCHEVPVDFYTLSEEAMKMPYVVTGGGHYTVGDKNYTKRKNLDNYQLIVTVEGSGIVEMNNQTFICEKGSAILIDCMEYHYTRCKPGCIWNHKHIHFTAKNDCQALVKSAVGFLMDGQEIHISLDKIFNEIQNYNAYSHYLITNYLSNILTDMIMLMFQNKVIPVHIKRMKNAAKFMQEHMHEKILIQDIAKESFLSVFYFTRQFKEYFGAAPYDYLLRIRINRAKILLLNGSSVQETAVSCGFGTSNNFFRNFKKSTGQSPSEFVKQHSIIDVETYPE